MNTILRIQNASSWSRNLLCHIQKTSFCCSKNFHISSVPVLSVIPTPSLSVSRNFWETFPGTRPILQLKDGIDRETHELIFRSKLFNYAFYAQLISMSTFVGQTIYLLRYAYLSVYNEVGMTLTTFGGFHVNYDLRSAMIVLFFTLHYALLYHIAQKICLRVYHKIDTDEYVFVSLRANPFKSRLTYCKPGELTPLNSKGLMNFLGNFKIKERKLYFKYVDFFDLTHFNRLLSKPIDPE